MKMKQVKDLQPGTHFRRPNVDGGQRELVKLANPYNAGHGGCAHFSFDPKNFELIGSKVGSSETVPVEAKRPETRNHVTFADDELQLIEAVLSNTCYGPTGSLVSSITGKIRSFLPGTAHRAPHTLYVNGQHLAIGRGPCTKIEVDE